MFVSKVEYFVLSKGGISVALKNISIMKFCGLFVIVVIVACLDYSESLGLQQNGEKSKDLQELIGILRYLSKYQSTENFKLI